MKNELENLLLQAAGRTGGSSSGRPHPHGRRRQDSYSDRSSDSDEEASRYNKKKPLPSGSQVPLKKRHQEYSSDGGDSDSAPSVGSDLYKDEDDKEELQGMTELQREMILAERSTKRDDQKLKELAMARAQEGKGERERERERERGGGSGRRRDRDRDRDSSPPPPPTTTAGRGSAGRTSVRGAEKSAAARIALDELLARRKRKQDSEGYRNRLRNLGGDSLANHDRSPPPLRRRPGTPPSDGGKSDSEDRKDDELPEDSPTRPMQPIKFEDIKDITILRSRLLKWFMDPFFEDLLPGCFVRVGIHQHKDGRRKYRLYMVRSVDASDPDKTYKFEHYTTYKYLILVTRTETSIDKCKMAEVSDSPPLENEFQEWLQLAENNGMRIPSRQELVEKKEAIQRAMNFVYSAETVKQLLQEKKLATLRPANVAAEKDRLRKELEVARARHDDAEADRIVTRLRQLEQMQPKQVDSKAARLAEMNRRNRAENFKNASEMKPVNTGLKAGEAGYDPFSRRWTRSTNYYMSKKDGEGSSVNVETDGGVKGMAETAAAQEAAAGEGKLVDTKAPVDPGTAMYQMHNFEVRIDLTKLQQLGSTPADRVFNGRLLRRQRQEITIGRKVPESDGKRHPLTLSISDYKRRRGLL